MSHVEPSGFFYRFIRWFVESRLIVGILLAIIVCAGISFAPFAWKVPLLPSDPIAVDAIPDIGDNQQIVYTTWAGRSPRDVEDQITYPLTTALLGVSGVKTVRSTSAFGFSSIQLIFEDDVDFYWSRARILEKLSSLPSSLLPAGVQPALGPDATGLGQIFWYTLEPRDPQGHPTGGWDLDELRSIQDFTVKYALTSVSGVAEVASIGGFTREYQVDIDPEALRAANLSLNQVAAAVSKSNLDIGARTIEINRVEYVVRGLGLLKDTRDLEETVLVARQGIPIRIKDVARVSLGPGLRRGALDDAGAPAVGGVVVARYGENPLATIEAVKERIRELEPGLPSRTLADGTLSKIHIAPFYDRASLIDETLGTLRNSLTQALLITLLVVTLMLRHLRSSLLIAAMLPLGVLLSFVAMRLAHVDANIMALGGIAIAIGTMVDLGIVFIDNMKRKLDEAGAGASRIEIVSKAAAEVAPAVLTSVLTTVVSFLPVLGLSAGEYKLFAPLALTKTYSMIGALLLAIVVLPTWAYWTLRPETPALRVQAPQKKTRADWSRLVPFVAALLVTLFLTHEWMPLGYKTGVVGNLLFVGSLVGLVLGGFAAFERIYPRLLGWILAHKARFFAMPLLLCALATLAAFGSNALLPSSMAQSAAAQRLAKVFPGFGREYMPPFDEGAFLYMPTTMPHASMAQTLEQLSMLDAAIAQIPEVDRVVGKLGRVDSALDPAPISMFEIVVTYEPEYRPGPDGRPQRVWRDHIRNSQDIWEEIQKVATLPGLTSAPLLMPIGARLVMLQSGMRAPMGIKVHGPDLESIEKFGLQLETVLKKVPGVRAEAVFADRVVGKPYQEIAIDREAIARFGLTVQDVQQTLTLALGGPALTYTVEGRERYPVRVRYMREMRDSVEAMERVYVTNAAGTSVPLSQVAKINYERGPQAIRSEDTFNTSYVLFDKDPDAAEVDVVQRAQRAISEKLRSGAIRVPAGVRYEFSGSYENQLRSEKKLGVLVPLALSLVFILLYLQFRRVSTVLIIYSGVFVAVAGGLLLLWLYAQPGFLDFSIGATSMRDLFRVHPTNLSVAVWVGFIALIGLATDDGVVMSTHIQDELRVSELKSVSDVRALILEAGKRRVRPCLMTTATTLLALLPVLSSQGRGADLMAPMVLPTLGGMSIALLTLFIVPTLSSWREERRVRAEHG